MASYVYNPSRKVTELLSKYLEFDPESLEMGIWSGDLSLKNVNLKRDAVKPLLNMNRKRSNSNYNNSNNNSATDATRSSLYGGKRGLDTSDNDPLDEDPTTKDPLRVKLVKGTIGNLRMRIPWKQLVWGQGAVQLEVSDVEIVLSLQSREETAREEAKEALEEERKKKEEESSSVCEECGEDDDDFETTRSDATNPKNNSSKKKKKKDDRSMIYHKAYREAKQRRLREAERRQLSSSSNNNNSDLALWLEQLHQKQSIAKEAHRTEQKELGVGASGTNLNARKSSQRYPLTGAPSPSSTTTTTTPTPPTPKEGNFDRLLKSFSSDFFWRMFAGVKGNISKARIVLLQDGIEVGCIIQSIEVVAGKDGIESLEIHSSNNSNSRNSNTNDNANANPAAATTAGSNSSGGLVTAVDGLIDKMQMPVMAAFDDGEHIDKVLKQSGIGIFVRRETNRKQLTRIPSELRFSTSVEADDYILRPVAALNIGLSFFYPHPPERRKKIPATAVSSSVAATTNTNTNTSSTTAASTNTNIATTTTSILQDESRSVASSTMSNKRRRGKRDKEKPGARPVIQTTLSNEESIGIAHIDNVQTPASAATYFSDPRIPLDEVPTLPLPSEKSAEQQQRLQHRKIRSTSSSSGTTFSDPRVPLENESASASPERRGRLKHTKSARGSSSERNGRLRRTKSANSDSNQHGGDAESLDSSGLVWSSFRSSGAAADRRHPAQRMRTPLRGSTSNSSHPLVPTPLKRGSTYPRPMPRASSASNLSNSMHSLLYGSASATVTESYTPTVLPDLPAIPCPRLQVRVGVDDVQVVFTTLHYELLNYLLCTVARMKNGRPDRTIRSVKVTEPGSELRELLKRKSNQNTPNNNEGCVGVGGDASEVVVAAASSGLSSYWWSSSTDLITKEDVRKSTEDQASSAGSFANGRTFDDNLLYLRGIRLKSARQEVVTQWWKYAIGAIKWEVRKRKHMTSVFRDMYISFDWKKQRHRRQEYINAFIAKQEHNNSDNTGLLSSRFPSSLNRSSKSSRVMNILSSSSHRMQREIEETLAEIEDELSIEQILLYRSIARSMRVRGTTQMPRSVYELWGKEGLTSAEITRKKPRAGNHTRPSRYPVTRLSTGSSGRTLNTSFESQATIDNSVDEGEGDEGLLAKVQTRFEKTRKLRDKGGVLEHFAREAKGLNDTNTETVANDVGDSGSFDGLGKTLKKPSKAAIEAGRFYASNTNNIGDIRSRADGRTIRSSKFGRSSQSRGMTASTTGDTRAPKAAVDHRMRLFFSVQIKKFNLIVVEEKCLYDLSSHMSGGMAASSNRFLNSENSERDSSSVVSDLSVLTDDKGFFGDDGSEIDRIVEEEEEDYQDTIGRPQFKSMDFLSFGQPENPLLRLTISSFITNAKGISGGGMEIGMSVGRIEATGDKNAHFLSMGPSEPSVPIDEVDINVSVENTANKRKPEVATDGKSVGASTFFSRDHLLVADGIVFTKSPVTPVRHAISLKFCKGGPTKTLQCDLSKIEVSANVGPAENLLRFYSRPDVKKPENLLIESSRDVARKIMVKKISNAPTTKPLASITSAIRIHGIEVKVPFTFDNKTYQLFDSEDSDLDSSLKLSNESDKFLPGRKNHRYSTVLELETLELYSGVAVDELIQSSAMMSDAKDRSVAGASLCSSIRSQTFIRTLEMLDVAELTGANDSFASNHFVFTMRGVTCRIESTTTVVPKLMDIPVNVEALITSNELSLLDTDSPKQQIVVEVSPVQIMLSEHRLELLFATQSALEFGKLGDGKAVMKKKIHPDPPRIEILSQRILSSLDVNCRRLRVELVKDKEVAEAILLPPNMKELVMEETLSDFLSIVACFDLSLPHEEALSSAMQVCIGRLVGIGLSDDEAWSCTTHARGNFLDDIARMRQAQMDLMEVMSEVISAVSSKSEIDDGSESSDSGSSNDVDSHGDEFSDDDSNKSANMVETTINNAVELTVASFSTYLRSFFKDQEQLEDSTFLFLDLPTGLSLSSINLFYDHHVAFLVPSLVATNKAGIELLTLVPKVKTESSVNNTEEKVEKSEGVLNHGISFSRFNLDKNHGFGKGGLSMGVLASDEGAESDLSFRERSRLYDVKIGELEFCFSSSIFEEIIDEFSLLLPKKSDDTISGDSKKDNGGESLQTGHLPVTTSTVMMASSLSLLFTSETLVPFCRLTLENMCYKNNKAMESLGVPELPTFALVASGFALQNLSPEGQFYPDVLSLLSPGPSTGFPFQVRFFQSPDSWKISNRLEIDFTSFRLFLVRQFINDLLHYFVYDHYGVGKLRKKYESNVEDIHGNGKPPLLYSVYIYDSSIICPRNSNSTDMVAFEVDDACIAVSYVPETFAMPTESSPYWENPPQKSQQSHTSSSGAVSRSGSFISLSDYEDCESFLSHEASGPVSSHRNDLIRRLKISLDRIQVFTALAEDNTTQDFLSSSLFRLIHTIDGRAEDLKEVYKKESNMERNLRSENIFQFKSCIQSWEEISTNPFSLEILFDSAPHTRLLVSCNDGSNPLSLDARLSQLCLLLSVWDSNMQELGTMFPLSTKEVFESAKPPTIPDNFPEYCSKNYVSYLESIESSIRSEICCMFKRISFRCTFDEPGYFSIDPNCFQYFEDPECADEVKPGLILSIEDMVVHVLNNHLNVKRIGIGSSSIDLTDERKVSFFQNTLSSDPFSDASEDSKQQIVFADLSWGLREDIRTLGSSLSQPVQCSIFMTPGWSLTNLGIQSANGTMHDLSWIWVLLDYFKSYYSDGAFGNLGFEAQKWTHRIKNALRRSANKDTQQFKPLPGVNIDFRVWLCQPILCLPSDNYDPQAPSLVLSSETGFWYRYKSVNNFSSQEVASTDLNLSFANEFLSPEKFRRETNSKLSRTTCPIRPLIEGLSFGLRYDCNYQFHHKDVSVVIPFSGEDIPSLSVDGKELEIEPIRLPPPKVLKPFRHRRRNFGSKACDITCIIEVLPLTSAAMMNFLTGPSEVNMKFAPKQDDGPPQTLSMSANLGDVRLFIIDPDLGVQLPIAVLSLASTSLTMSKFAIDPITEGLDQGESQPADMQIILKNNLWVDYFKLGLTRSWEPLLEPFEFEILYETSSIRGQGYSFNSDCPMHFNISGALLSFLFETIDSFSSIIAETFGEKDKTKGIERRESIMGSLKDEDKGGIHLKDIIKGTNGHEMNIIHEIPKPLKTEDRVAFSLRNLTGQRIRIHQQSNFSNDGDQPVVVTYLNQGESSGLTFAATISVVKNLRIVEVPYPGFEVSKNKEYQKQGSLNHAIDLQVPGCRWIQGVRVDSFGRKFQSLTPRSSQVFAKISNDWRLRNAMTLLTEVGPDNGGRLLSVRSVFEIRNNTTHSVNLVFHPDPKYKPDAKSEGRSLDAKTKGVITKTKDQTNPSEYAVVEPGCDFQLPTLLIESSLEMEGSHLGSVWVRPDTSNTDIFSFRDFSKPTNSEVEKFDASFCSRPVQLARIVHETSLLYQNGAGEDIEQSEARSGVQVSCATHSQNGNIRTPFCYAIEIVRSPIVKSNIDAAFSSDAKDGLVEKNKKKKKPDNLRLIHGPVAYSLAIHSPIVIVNLLPASGRFELMHAIKKTVVWYADLEPGQQVPIHSLGLDLPLLLLVNLGFCRTPIGEGALVHHGGDTVVNSRETSAVLKSFGKAVTNGTKKIGRTLTTLTDSTDKRAQERVAKVVSPKAKRRRRRKRNVKHMRSSVDNDSLGLDIDSGHTETDRVGGRVHSIEGMTYSAADIADETTVVDSLGQRLTLRIENVRGGGGQRRISLYCPFWIVNTTEHALRYKEDKEKRYVCGTVISPGKDGSMPVDGSNRQYRSRYEMQSKRRVAFSSPPLLAHSAPSFDDAPMNPETVFAGTHGALATSPGRCTLSPENISALIDQDIPLQKLAKSAFMFNFHEDGLGGEKLMIQLYDGLRSYENKHPDYTSGWSTGFGLETVGFSQVIRIPCKDGRMLELSATVNVAPGFLSGYTKIVRFCPRYAIYNRLERPIRLWQDSSIVRSLSEDRSDATNQLGDTSDSRKWRYEFEDKRHTEKISQYESIFGRNAVLKDRHDQLRLPIPEGTTAHRSALYISSVGPSQLAPFFLPDTRSDSQLRIDVGGPWNLTSSFASNIPGEYVLPIARATDIRMLNHVSTRDAPKYKVVLPPPNNEDRSKWDGELGAYFETEWVSKGDRKILVKGTKRGKYAFNHTDMHVGDELLRINGISVLKMTFQEAMGAIKGKLSDIRVYQEKIKLKQNGGNSNTKNAKGVLRRLSMSGRQSGSTNSERNNPNRGLRRLSLGVRKRSQGTSSEFKEEEIIEPSQLTMTFRTQEERLRKLRIKAIMARNAVNTIGNFDPEYSSLEPIDSLTVETKALHNTMFVILRHANKDNPPFKIQNRSLKYFIFYRQRNCEEHEWSVLAPGESRSYCWEEPMKSKKLTVRIAIDTHEPPKESCEEKDSHGGSNSVDRKLDFETEPEEVVSAVRTDRLKQVLAYQYVDNEERGGLGLPTTVRLEEIGFQTTLPVPSFMEGLDQKTKYLNCEVDTDGGTRLLVVSDLGGEHDERQNMHLNLESLKKQISNEETRTVALQSMRYALSHPVQTKHTDHVADMERANIIENDLRELVEDFPEGNSISKRCQVVVQVLEAIGLRSSDLVRSSNPYCEVFYKGRSRSRKHFLQKRKNKRKTYFIEKTSNPRWNDQYFVFDVPEAAIEVNRGHSINIVVRDFRSIGQHPILGQASMYFASIRNQQELEGWWPLVGKYGSSDVSVDRISDFGRGSIKLRAQWIYTLPAMIDYYSLLSQRRLLALTKTEKGMQEQLKSAEESFQRKREAIDRLPGSRIAKLVKLKRRTFSNRDAALKRELLNKESKAKIRSPLNANFSHLRDTLKLTRKQSMNALTLQTVESKRKRQLVLDEIKNDIHFDEASRTMRLSSTSSISAEKDSIRALQHPLSTTSRDRTKSLGDFFAQQRGSITRSKRNVEWNAIQHKSHRKLSLELDDPFMVESMMDCIMIEKPSHLENNTSSRQALHNRRQSHSQHSETWISDIISESTDGLEQARRKNDIARLNALGFVFHESGNCFHEDHLPNHFRRLLFASSLKQKSQIFHCREFFVGTSSSIRQFKNWQAALALLWDPDVDVVQTKKSFLVQLSGKMSDRNCMNGAKNLNTSKSIISQKLSVPDEAPRVTVQRSKHRIEAMYLSRTQFDRSCRRILGCVLNPGGWLTIRPIVAMNLPDSYNGMYVKVSHGSEVQVSETVDAKVSPKWSSASAGSSSTSKVKGRRKASSTQQPDTMFASSFEFSENDLHLHVEPQQTGGSIRLSVIAERYKTKVELGVVNIPVGAAIAACIDTAQDMELSGYNTHNAIPMYTRWFPLMEPQLTVPVAGDMGLSTRAQENEQLRDNMFQYAPCIQLSLIWWPYDQNQNESKDQADAKSDMKAVTKKDSSVVSQITRIPTIQTYFNADVSVVSLALIDSVQAVELLNLSLREIDVKYAVTQTKTRIGLVVGWIQMDRQDDNSRESVVFAPTPTEYRQPTLQFLALKDNLRTKSNIVSYEYVGVALQEMDLTVEEPSVYELWDFVMAVMTRKRIKERAMKGQRHADVVSRNANIFRSFEADAKNPALFAILQSAGNRGALSKKQKMYVEQLILGLVKINLSYVKGKKQNLDVTENGRNAIQNFTVATGGGQIIDRDVGKKNGQSEVFTRWSQLTSDEDSVWGSAGAQNNLPSIIAAVFPSVSDAPIRLQGKLVEHVFESPIEIASSLKNYYTNETLKQVYKIIGSLDFVGNPTILLSSFMSGVKDLVSVPTAAFMKSPANVKQVGIGVGKGTVSFLSHSASGFFGFSARLLSQAGQFTAFFSLDSEYRQWHRDRVVNEATNLERAWKRRGMPTAEEIVLRPVADVVLGFTLGVSGVVMSPYRGARKGGMRGFVVGTGVGVAGLVTKPIVGVLDAMTHGSQSIHDIAKTVNFLERRYQPVLKLRLPHVFGPMKILTPFDAISAQSVYLLGLFPPKIKLKRRLDKGRELHVHSEVLYMEPGVATYAIATNIRVVLIKLRRDTANSHAPTFGWEVELTSAATISSQILDHGHNGVALTITKSANWVPPQTGKLSKKMSEITTKTRLTSGASSLASIQVAECDEEDEEAGDLGESFQSIQLTANSTTAKPLSQSLTAGVTKKGNKTLEWFTVLAEYPQRKQLTQLHNVICCIVGDYDAIISDRAQTQASPNGTGTTSFGIYNFEKGLPDGRAAKMSNTKVIASLENLFWLESNLVQRIDKISSPDRKQRALNRVRNSWDFSNDMKASVNIGGPEWLIEARAKAMCIGKGLTEFENDLRFSSNSKETGEVSNQHREGMRFFPDEHSGLRSISSGNRYDSSEVFGASRQSNDSSGQSSRKINAFTSDEQQSMSSNSTRDREQMKPKASSTSWNVIASDTATAHRAPVGSMEQSQEAFNESGNLESNEDINELEQDFYSPINGIMTDSGHIEVFRDDRHQPPVPSLYVPASQPSNRDSSSRSTNGHSRTVTATASSFESSRIDRLEGVMEQLLILNAAQAHREEAASEARTASADASTVYDLADTLKQELVEIREKMETRAREDEILRQEIGMLRGQLAEKRCASDTGSTRGLERNNRRPPPMNTQFLKTNPIRGIFNTRKKNKNQNRRQQLVSDESSGRNEGNSRDSSSHYLPSLSDDNHNLPLGLDDDQSGSQ